MVENFRIEKLLNLKYKVFDDAEMGFTSIPIIKKEKNSDLTYISESNNIEEFLNEKYIILNQNEFKNYPDNKFLFGNDIEIWNKSFKNVFDLSSKKFQFYNGIKTGNNDKFISNSKLTDQYKEIITGKDFQKYYVSDKLHFVLYDPQQLWSNTNAAMYTVPEKLIFRRTSDKLLIGFDNQGRFCQDTIHILFSKTDECSNKYLLTILNSKFLNFLYRIIVPEIGKAFAEVKIVNLKKLPVKSINNEYQKPFIEKADEMLSLNKDIQEVLVRFQRTCERKFENLKPNKKLQDWYKLSYADFVKELTKQKIKLTLSEEAEWGDYFDQEKNKALEIQTKIASIDREIDQMVYELYGLSEEEIEIVERS